MGFIRFTRKLLHINIEFLRFFATFPLFSSSFVIFFSENVQRSDDTLLTRNSNHLEDFCLFAQDNLCRRAARRLLFLDGGSRIGGPAGMVHWEHISTRFREFLSWERVMWCWTFGGNDVTGKRYSNTWKVTVVGISIWREVGEINYIFKTFWKLEDLVICAVLRDDGLEIAHKQNYSNPRLTWKELYDIFRKINNRVIFSEEAAAQFMEISANPPLKVRSMSLSKSGDDVIIVSAFVFFLQWFSYFYHLQLFFSFWKTSSISFCVVLNRMFPFSRNIHLYSGHHETPSFGSFGYSSPFASSDEPSE